MSKRKASSSSAKSETTLGGGSFYIHSLTLERLWGHMDRRIRFHPDINVLIGPNGSGKTTILNVLQQLVTGSVEKLLALPVGQAVAELRSFSGDERTEIGVKTREYGIELHAGEQLFEIRREEIGYRWDSASGAPALSGAGVEQFRSAVAPLVNLVWLPVSRRLPVQPDADTSWLPVQVDDVRPESVDVKLNDLLGELENYRLTLRGRVSELYKEFEGEVLSTILYDKRLDSFTMLPSAPEQDDIIQLKRAFDAAGLLAPQVEARIDKHFEVAISSLERIRAALKTRPVDVDPQDVLVMPLITRTDAMVEAARKLHEKRSRLFSALGAYERAVSTFLRDKQVRIDEKTPLTIETGRPKDSPLEQGQLSSGEKQVLIFLTQALLFEERPVVFMADEPELSLHVTWQEHLLESLLQLGNTIQVIVATHSPDIVGPFHRKVHDLGASA